MIGRGLLFTFAVAALAISGHPARAAHGPLRLAPSSKWYLNYADDSCRLARQFGTGKQTSWMFIDRFEPGDSFHLTVAGDPFRNARAGSHATVRFGPDEGEQKLSYKNAEIQDMPTLIFPGGLRIAPETEQEEKAREDLKKSDEYRPFEPAPIGPERERASTFLFIDAPGAPEIVFETGSLGEPFAALRKCVDELVTHWGIDAEADKSLTRRAVPTEQPGNWLTSSDYPVALVRKGAEGIVHFRLNVDKQGNVSDCHIQRSTRPKGFDDAVCAALTQRARFKPALDAKGDPIASYYVGTVRFVMP